MEQGEPDSADHWQEVLGRPGEPVSDSHWGSPCECVFQPGSGHFRLGCASLGVQMAKKLTKAQKATIAEIAIAIRDILDRLDDVSDKLASLVDDKVVTSAELSSDM
jgi:hypothetical protein